MIGQRFFGYTFAVIAVAAFIGFLSGANHQLAIAIIAAVMSIVMFSENN